MEIIAIERNTFNSIKKQLDNFFEKIGALSTENMQRDKWLSNQDVCSILQISKRSLQYYRDCGKLSFSQIRGKCYYKTSDVEQLVKDSVITKK